MIALKTIVTKVGKKSCRIVSGKIIPANILAFWQKTGEIDFLKKSGIIGDGKKDASTQPVISQKEVDGNKEK